MPVVAALAKKDYSVRCIKNESKTIFKYFGIEMSEYQIQKIGFRTFLLSVDNESKFLLKAIDDQLTLNIEDLWSSEKDISIDYMKNILLLNCDKIFGETSININGYAISKIGHKAYLLENGEDSNILINILYLNGSCSILFHQLDLGIEKVLTLIPPKKAKIKKEHINKYKNS